MIIVGASLSVMAQSEKWRGMFIGTIYGRNCVLATQCSYVDVLSVRHGNAVGNSAQGATETDGESGFWQWRASVAEWTLRRCVRVRAQQSMAW